MSNRLFSRSSDEDRAGIAGGRGAEVEIANSLLAVLAGKPHPMYEAWQMSGPDGLLIVCAPGGDHIAVWKRSPGFRERRKRTHRARSVRPRRCGSLPRVRWIGRSDLVGGQTWRADMAGRSRTEAPARHLQTRVRSS